MRHDRAPEGIIRPVSIDFLLQRLDQKILERRIEETGELQWFFLVNLSGMKIEPSAWYAYSRRGRSLNETYSMGSVRFDPSEEARLWIERAANIEAFEPNLFSTRDEALAKIKSFRSTRRNSSVEATLSRQDAS